MSQIVFIPLIVVLGAVFLILMSRRHRSRPAGPDDGTGGRPDETERPELRGDTQHRERRER